MLEESVRVAASFVDSGARFPLSRGPYAVSGTSRLRCKQRFTRAKAASSHSWFFFKPRYVTLVNPNARFKIRKGHSVSCLTYFTERKTRCGAMLLTHLQLYSTRLWIWELCRGSLKPICILNPNRTTIGSIELIRGSYPDDCGRDRPGDSATQTNHVTQREQERFLRPSCAVSSPTRAPNLWKSEQCSDPRGNVSLLRRAANHDSCSSNSMSSNGRPHIHR